MTHLNFLNDYFIKIHQNFGISKLEYDFEKLEIEDKDLRNMVFASDDFDRDFEGLHEHCKALYRKLKRGYSVKIKRIRDNHYSVLLF